MPLNTAVPNARRISLPAPVAINSGIVPRTNENAVIRIGRSRNRHASIAASTRSLPSSSSCFANSTIRIAFLHASPTSTTKPIWVRMLLSMPRSHTPKIANSRHIGTIRITASGSSHDSYWADNARNTNSTHSGKMNNAVLPACFCWNARSVHS